MPLILAGIDEAGYGPLLGPLCVGLTVFEVPDGAGIGVRAAAGVIPPENAPDAAGASAPAEGSSTLADSPSEPDHRSPPAAPTTPNLWKLLSRGVCRAPQRGGAHDKKMRIAVADSKELKLANSIKTAHPLVHLERGVLAFAKCLAENGLCADGGELTDAALFACLGAELPGHACYGVQGAEGVVGALPLPVSLGAGEVGIAANVLRGALAKAGVRVLGLRCRVVCEREYNRILSETGNKAETTAAAVGEYLRRVWEEHAGREGVRLGVVCDRLGGRAQYAGLLERELPGTRVEIIEESPQRSRYVVVDTANPAKRAGVAFLVEGESAHLPVALASMTAKLTRELAMRRFNAYWGEQHRALAGVELRPTAGYSQDARRWLEDIGGTLGDADRLALVRLA